MILLIFFYIIYVSILRSRHLKQKKIQEYNKIIQKNLISNRVCRIDVTWHICPFKYLYPSCLQLATILRCIVSKECVRIPFVVLLNYVIQGQRIVLLYKNIVALIKIFLQIFCWCLSILSPFRMPAFFTLLWEELC